MHPNERPATARDLRDLLLNVGPRTGAFSSQLALPPLPVDQPNWLDVLRQNRILVGVAGALLLVAVLMSLI